MDLSKISAGRNPPLDLHAVIEIPVGGVPVKYELDEASGAMFVDRFLHTAMFYPANYGFIPHTLSEDGDPCDIMVVGSVPVIPGAVIRCRPVGALLMQDEAGLDEKVLAVPVDELHPFYSGIHDYTDLPPVLTEQITHFFKHYKDLEQGKWVKVVRWLARQETEDLVRAAIARCDAAKAHAHLQFAERETLRVPDIPADASPRPVRSAAVIGAGTMGRGIAICCANAALPVVLVDTGQEALDRARASIGQTYDSMVQRGRLTAGAKEERMQRIRTSVDYAALRDADVVIEAVFEDLELKQRIFTQLDAVAKPGAVLATNTSTLDIDAIAAATQRPGDVIGLHFFSPANVMPLLEVVRTNDTAPEVIRTALDLARTLRKTPVLARVCYGFIGNRMMEGYAREAERIVLEGATPHQVDSALENWGMAMGILAVFDLAGIDVGVNVHRSNAHRYPPDPTYYQADLALYEAGRLGQKTGKGYYRYEGRKRIDDPEAVAILRARARALAVPQSAHGDDEILERCLYPLMNEGFRILGEGIAMRASDIDVVWTAGYGFPRDRGGPMFHAQTIGLPVLLAGMRKYGERFGTMHWEPAPLLVELVESGRLLADWERGRGPVVTGARA